MTLARELMNVNGGGAFHHGRGGRKSKVAVGRAEDTFSLVVFATCSWRSRERNAIGARPSGAFRQPSGRRAVAMAQPVGSLRGRSPGGQRCGVNAALLSCSRHAVGDRASEMQSE